MSKKDHGGPAYPAMGAVGMTIRDFFAAQVLPSLISDGKATDAIVKICRDNKLDGLALTAQMCYEYADAMLAERSKP